MHTVKIYYLKHVERIDEAFFEKLLLLLPGNFQQEIKAYKHWESAQASLLSKLLLLHGMSDMGLHYKLEDIQFGHKERPYIHRDFDFNISHSGQYVIVAISKGARLGIDVEKHRKLEVNLFRKYFDESEWSGIQSSPDPTKTFFNLWSIKESAIKCDGRGVEVLSNTHISNAVHPGSNKVICDGTSFYYTQLMIDDSYSFAVSCNKEFEMEICVMDLRTLIE